MEQIFEAEDAHILKKVGINVAALVGVTVVPIFLALAIA